MAQTFNPVSFIAGKFRDLGNELSRQVVSRYFWRDLLSVFLGVMLDRLQLPHLSPARDHRGAHGDL